jgi:hypothetical protein
MDLVLKSLRGRLTYANVLATAAIFVALGGGAYAVTAVPSAATPETLPLLSENWGSFGNRPGRTNPPC